MATPFDTITPATASDAAIALLTKLMMAKAKATGADTAEAAVKIMTWLETHNDSATVSANIDRLKAEGYAPEREIVAGADEVPAGRYAIDTTIHAINGTAFYKVDRPTEGRWAGYVFVKQIVGDEERRLSQKQGGTILRRIAEVGAEAASARYGHEIGECGVCGRTLTNDESRERGIGPICAEKMGW
ncbi:hypothetical protein SEA_BUCKEYE_47 [Mycobacterium phage Buckeye]|uniref:Uncharacterized protein n=6 Tax=Pegunavirus TaxID=1623295 RepID=A0A345KMS9_9CAUD|nr:hypothetical protein KNT94_gp38 [Mycobacterium phage KingTut]AOT23519.1 hypothetical protein SEA_IRIDOCLYSIS_47 [Mycobacterium phage Iridoclysis]AUV60450.1 hypothetical protein SEA_HAIMAS_47 [Mycobacterium phage Haimas]AXC35688.1 hypothetical protein SEA_CHILDISH_46 [Mycobacterium phage Childish]AXC38020.1 hypothetical protein SEA_MUTANTE_46 [Mycobacterium phage Mutante]AXH43875.1 hypothetical protein SEA_BUCKEYE_47 [Mycobacterium phage Buckeye]AYD86418.1 hypothetical protein SEA_HAMISH_47